MRFPCSLLAYADSFSSYAAAIADARRRGLILCKYADPIEGEARDLTDEQAAMVMQSDIGLIFVDDAESAVRAERDHLRNVLACERGAWAPEGWRWAVDSNLQGYWISAAVKDAQGWPAVVRRLTPTGWTHDGVTRSDTAYAAIMRAAQIRPVLPTATLRAEPA